MNTDSASISKNRMRRPIYNITPFSLLDYPNHTACILWFAGCNMRCLYCYNPEIVLGKGKISIKDTERFLQSRRSLLQAVVFSGGECTSHPSLPSLVQTAKELGFLVKIDTNGTNPTVLNKLIENNLIDYIALDFKASQPKHQIITKSDTFTSFTKSLDMLLYSEVPFEVRTTWHRDLLSVSDLKNMISFLEARGYTGDYFIQHFLNGVSTLAELSHHTKQDIRPTDLSTDKIKVIFRNISD